ncbi:MAG: hypothetical protein CBB68_14675 [Rhodospirillaceae bacterium TMED8]|nr:hypothetical protein [Magnetovibrio sp.]OUT47970.1 MAG: hypothetical protein CBB68_14675 [Rhodospirillaceae bacterium TMED8]
MPCDLNVFQQSLKALTKSAIKSRTGTMSADLNLTRQLLKEATNANTISPLDDARALLDSCRTKGTLPFARLARHGFIAVSFLRSLVERGVFSASEAEGFMHGIHTIAYELVSDMRKLRLKEVTDVEFLGRYGHLRPGTYDILSKRYDEQPDLYLGHSGRDTATKLNVHEPTAAQKIQIGELLSDFGYDLSADELLAYIVDSVKAREESKFAFSRYVSDTLVALTKWGHSNGLEPDDLSFFEIEEIFSQTPDELKSSLPLRRNSYNLSRALRLPHLIREPHEIDVFGIPLGHPTFITGRAVIGPSLRLTAHNVVGLDGNIIMIESADPGFDWVFSHDIKGLITCFGGANSHMAIRCAEFSLPAAIGCGERIFSELQNASVIELNCGARSVKSAKY